MPSKSNDSLSHYNVLVALPGFVWVLDHILLLGLAHALDFVEVDNEAGIVGVVQLDALPTKMVRWF